MLHGLKPALFVILALWAGAASAQQAGSRIALVIGNSDYAASPLPTATNDAGLMATTLMQAGFDVTAAADPDTATLRKLVQTFAAKAQAASGSNTIIVTYLSGYGLQANGDNFLVPVDARIARDVDVPAAALSLSNLSHSLESVPAKARIFIYDLAHDTPFAKAGAPLASGLSLVEAEPGSLIAFNTAPGTVAPIDVATYGVFARTLSDLLATPGLPMTVLFERLRLRVAQVTNGSTVPWDDATLDATFALRPSATPDLAPDAASLADHPLAGLSSDVGFFLTLARDRLDGDLDDLATFPGDPLSSRVETMTAVRREALIWAASVRANVDNAFWSYMRLYPRGPHLLDARRRLAALHAPLEPPPRFDMQDLGSGAPTPDELALVMRHPLTLDDPDWAPLPLMPDGLIPPSPPDDVDLSVPPLALAGALPIPMPMATGTAATGSILQPFVPSIGDVVSTLTLDQGQEVVMVTSSAKTLLSRTTLRREQDRRIVTQRDAHDAIISRTITTFGPDVVTTVQTGPAGGILRNVVTHTDSSGDHTMTISTGRNQMVATVDRDKTGMITNMERGPAPIRDPTIIVGSGSDHESKTEPVITPRPALDTTPKAPVAPAIPASPPELKVEAVPPPVATPSVPAATVPTPTIIARPKRLPPPRPDHKTRGAHAHIRTKPQRESSHRAYRRR